MRIFGSIAIALLNLALGTNVAQASRQRGACTNVEIVVYDSVRGPIRLVTCNGDVASADLLPPDDPAFPVTTAREVDEAYKLTLANGGPQTNLRGYGEHYFKGTTQSATNAGWYFILPSGAIYAWAVTRDGIGGSVQVGRIAPELASDPMALVEASTPIETPTSLEHVREATGAGLAAGALYANFRGWGEKYFLGNGAWYFILPTGKVYRWIEAPDGLAASTARPPIAALGADAWRNPYQFLVASAASAASASELASAYAFTALDGGMYFNQGGAQEKYFRGLDLGTDHAGYYFILPSGGIYAYSLAAGVAGSIRLGTVDPAFHGDPLSLIEAKLDPSEKTSVATLRTEIGAGLEGDSLYANLHGWNEKYFLGNGAWYVLVSSGRVYRYVEGSLAASMKIAPIATVGADVWRNPYALLVADGDARTAPEMAKAYGFTFLDGGTYENYLGAQERYFRGISLGSDHAGYYFITPDGSVYALSLSRGIAGSTRLGALDVSYHDDVLRLVEAAHAEAPTADVASLTATLGLALHPSGSYRNYRGWHERYLYGAAGWYFVTKSGALYQFGASLATSVFVANLGAAFY